MNNVAIILANPQMGENIGAAARAMKNFAISDLRIVLPRDGWPNKAADNMSVGAIDIIKSAKIYNDLESAISDLDFLYAATAAKRDMDKEYVLTSQLTADISNIGANNIGVMFGRESSGLTNQEISYANKILTIETNSNFSSLNIAQAICVICYEIYKMKNICSSLQSDSDLEDIVTLEQKNHFHNQLVNKLEEQGFFRVAEKKEHMNIKIRNLFGKINKLSNSELKILYGIMNIIR